MKAKELIGVLSACDPETEIRFEFGGDDEYRLACARLISEQPLDIDWRDSITPMLRFLDISDIVLDLNGKEVTITFSQAYIEESGIDEEITKIAQLRRDLKKKKG